MTIGNKIAGKTKQLVAEVIGDGKLNEEGKEQARDARSELQEGETIRKPMGSATDQKN